jgi:hypothetical protein
MRRRSVLQTILATLSLSRAHADSGVVAAVSPKKFKLSGESIKQLIPSMGGALATDRITVDGKPVGYMYREEVTRAEDSGWCFFSGDESQSYIDDPSHTTIYDVNTIANYDPDIIPYLQTPAPCAFEKIQGSGKYKRVDR